MLTYPTHRDVVGVFPFHSLPSWEDGSTTSSGSRRETACLSLTAYLTTTTTTTTTRTAPTNHRGDGRCRRWPPPPPPHANGRETEKGSALRVWQIGMPHAPCPMPPSLRPGRRRPGLADAGAGSLSRSVSLWLSSSGTSRSLPSLQRPRPGTRGPRARGANKKKRGLTRHPKIELGQITLEVNAVSQNPDCSSVTTRAPAPALLCILLDRLSQPCPSLQWREKKAPSPSLLVCPSLPPLQCVLPSHGC